MHPLYGKADKLSREVIGAAIEVHGHKGSGLIESSYERCLLRELELRSIPATTQKMVCVEYKGLVFDEAISYMKLLDIPLGLLINFHEPILKNGVSRMILPRANRTEEEESREILL